MIITRTPFRMSFFGGGSDIEDYFKIHNGSVLSATFDKYVYVTVRHLPRFFSYSTELLYSVQERVSDINDIKHPMVRNAMKFMNMHELHIAYDADLPARTGLGTSSSFAVGLLNAFYAMKNKSASKDQLAKDAIYVERVLCNEAGGWQDQIAVSYGGMNRIDFSRDGYKVSPIKITAERLKKSSALIPPNILFTPLFTVVPPFSKGTFAAASTSARSSWVVTPQIFTFISGASGAGRGRA